MKKLIFIGLVSAIIIACNTTKNTTTVADAKEVNKTYGDTIRIANDELEYEIIIFDPNFSTWLLTQAKPRGYYGLSYLETKNIFYVTSWNIRVNQQLLYNRDLYTLKIDYDSNIRYGYEVNYLLYNYFVYFQKENRVRL